MSAQDKSSSLDRKPRKRVIIEDAILTKARRFVVDKNKDKGAEEDKDDNVNTGGDEESPPTKKMRKPRHDSVEGQKFLKAKEQARLREFAGSSVPFPTKGSTPIITNPENEKSAKKKKKKKKKGKVNLSTTAHSTPTSTPSSEEKYRREALSYLQLWKKHRDLWKFEKLKQVWLLKHALVIDNKRFALLLEYIGSMKGAARGKTREEMKSLMTGFEDRFDDSGKNEPEEQDRIKYDRARQIVQMLTGDDDDDNY